MAEIFFVAFWFAILIGAVVWHHVDKRRRRASFEAWMRSTEGGGDDG